MGIPLLLPGSHGSVIPLLLLQNCIKIMSNNKPLIQPKNDILFPFHLTISGMLFPTLIIIVLKLDILLNMDVGTSRHTEGSNR